MRKLKIAYLSLGTFTHIGPYIEFFKGRGHAVSWLVYDRPRRDFGVPTYEVVRGVSPMKTSTKWRYLLAPRRLRQILAEIKPDILHGHYITSSGTMCLLSGCRPYVLTVHGSDLKVAVRSRLWRPIVGVALRRAAFVNAVSDELCGMIRELGVPNERIVVATLGIDTQQFAFHPRRDVHRPLRLLCTRVLGSVYDPKTIVDACAILRDRGVDFTLTFAASGPLEPELRQRVEQGGLTDRVRFQGGYDNRSLPALIEEHDVYVSASLSDGTSISLLEAMASGIFPVVSDIASNSAWLDDGRTALMFRCGDAAGLADGIVRVLADDKLRRHATEENRRIVEERANRHDHMLRLERWYEQITSG